MATPQPKFVDAGEAALVVEFGTTVDPDINARVLALDRALTATPIHGVRETVPTYRSLMIHYDPLTLARGDLIAAVEALEAEPTVAAAPKNLWTIPCCYEPEFGEDVAR